MFFAFDTTPLARSPLPTHNLRQAGGLHVQHDGSLLDAGAQLKQAVQRQSGHVGFAPALAAFLHLLLELDPPGRMGRQHHISRLKPSECSFISVCFWSGGINPTRVFTRYFFFLFFFLSFYLIIQCTCLDSDRTWNSLVSLCAANTAADASIDPPAHCFPPPSSTCGNFYSQSSPPSALGVTPRHI